MSVTPARAMAFEILLRVELEDSYAAELLHSATYAALSPADHGLATELVMGVLRWRSLLDERIAKASSQKLTKLDAEVLTALRLGVYQLAFLDRIPARAAIHESVELVKRARKRSAVPFANAVLRKVAASAGMQAIDQVQDTRTKQLIARETAHPEWLVERWVTEFGVNTARGICVYDQSIPPTTIRLRSISAEDALRSEGLRFEAGAFLSTARRLVAGDVTKSTAYAEGKVTIQDEASQLVAALLGRGSRILDCCAAPGGKTWAVADRNPNVEIVAVELHAHRVELLRKRVTAPNVKVLHSDIRDLPVGVLFDRVLVDAPCSGTGTLARNPEIKWRLRASDLADLHAKQVAITHASMRQVAVGGRLIYSTCSLEPEENEGVIKALLRTNPSYRVLPAFEEVKALRQSGDVVTDDLASLVKGDFVRTVPGVLPCDGFFVAVLERLA